MASQPFPPSASLPWRADFYGEYIAIYDAQGTRLADVYAAPTVAEDGEAREAARLITAAPPLLAAVREAVATYQDRLSLLEEEREWRGDDEYRDMVGHYSLLLRDAVGALSQATCERGTALVFHAGKLRTLTIRRDEYQSGGIAVELCEEGDTYTYLSMVVEGVDPGLGAFVAKAYSENEGLLEALIAADVVEIVRRVPHAGLGELPVCRLVG